MKKEKYEQHIQLRAHHGLCIQFFEGKGYNKEFIDHMSKVIHTLKKNTVIEITKSCDIICRSCPNNIDDLCKYQEKASIFDSKTLEKSKISEGEQLSWEEFSNRIIKIIKSGEREKICKNCEWNDICGQIK